MVPHRTDKQRVHHPDSTRPLPTGGDAGSAAVEMVLCTPLLMLVLLVVVGLGRLVDARLTVADAAHQAARAASLARTPAQAQRDAQAVTHAALKNVGASCANLSIQVTTRGLKPGSAVTARVRCTTRLGDLTLSGLPGHVVVAQSALSPVDRYRGSR